MIDRGSSWPARPHRPAALRTLRVPLNIAERRLLLTALDVVAVGAALLGALAVRDLRAHATPGIGALTAHPAWFVILAGIWLAVAHALDAYEPRAVGRLEPATAAVVKAGLLTSMLYLLVPRLTPALPTSRIALVSFPVFVIVSLLLGRRVFSWLLPRPAYARQTLVVGAGWAGRTVARALLDGAAGGYEVVGFVDDDPGKAGLSVALAGSERAGADGPGGPVTELPVLGNRERVKDLIARHRVSTLILAITRDVDAELLQILMDCAERGVELIPMPVVYEQLTGRVPVEHVGDKWYAAVPIHPTATGRFWAATKRTIDIVLALTGLACLAPLLPLIALAIVLDSPGPVFYLQKRVGKGGTLFRAVKFRSMVWMVRSPRRSRWRGLWSGRPQADEAPGTMWVPSRDPRVTRVGRLLRAARRVWSSGRSGAAEPRGATWAEARDPRVTRVGRILRATHLDEFPQFINVLRGEMSVVGPRPERPEMVEHLAARIPAYRLRHIVKPGMGGWGLVRQGYVGSQEDALIRLQYDLYYIKHQSPWLDLVIILKTIMHAVTLKGR